MDGFKMFRVLGQEAREQLNHLRSDLKDGERAKWIKGRQEAIKREALKKRTFEREAVVAKGKGATFTKGELYDIEQAMLEGRY